MAEQPGGHAAVLDRDDIGVCQYVGRARGQIAEIADRGRDDVEAGFEFMFGLGHGECHDRGRAVRTTGGRTSGASHRGWQAAEPHARAGGDATAKKRLAAQLRELAPKGQKFDDDGNFASGSGKPQNAMGPKLLRKAIKQLRAEPCA